MLRRRLSLRAKRAGGGVVLALLGCAVLAAQSTYPASGGTDEVFLAQLRERFYVAVEDAAVTRELVAGIEQRYSGEPSHYPPVVSGYYAALEGLRGKHDANPLRKYRHVKNAIDMMEPLVAGHPRLLEVRFLRFSFYEQIPPLFGVQHHVPADLAVLVEMLESRRHREVPLAVQADMIDYILGTERPTPEQRRILWQLRLEHKVGRGPVWHLELDRPLEG